MKILSYTIAVELPVMSVCSSLTITMLRTAQSGIRVPIGYSNLVWVDVPISFVSTKDEILERIVYYDKTIRSL